MTNGGSSALDKLGEYKSAIDGAIAEYSKQVRSDTEQLFGRLILEAETDVFLDVLSRGGKRIRGSLVMAGYQMCDGTDQALSARAAMAIEMLHTYILIVDDIQDRSLLRRGRPTAHKMLEDYHKRLGFRGDPYHTGLSLALDVAIFGAHGAQVVLSNLEVDPSIRLRLIRAVNQVVQVTAHGQTLDILNELVDTPDQRHVNDVLEWKTAQYTIINPLQAGMILAGANDDAVESVRAYGLHVGKAFQVVDDILGIYGDAKDLGKTPGDDIREGKGTVLVLYTLQHAEPSDVVLLRESLGNPNLTPDRFQTCQQIIESSGALANAKLLIDNELETALSSLDYVKSFCNQEGLEFLQGIAKVLRDSLPK